MKIKLEWKMKKIFVSGLLVAISAGIIIFLGKLAIEVLTDIFSPLILYVLPEKNNLVIPMSIGLAILIIMLMGWLASLALVRKIFNNILKKTVPKVIEKRGAAVLELTPGVYIIAAVIKEIRWKNLDGEITKKCVLFTPSSPIPTSGLPIIFADRTKVTLLKILIITLNYEMRF